MDEPAISTRLESSKRQRVRVRGNERVLLREFRDAYRQCELAGTAIRRDANKPSDDVVNTFVDASGSRET